jgi:hypothetical protein
VLALFFFAGKLTDLASSPGTPSMLDGCASCNSQMQTLFRRWAECEPGIDPTGLFVNQSELPLLVRLNHELTGRLEDAALDQRMTANGGMLKALAGELAELAPETAAALGRLEAGKQAFDKTTPAGRSAAALSPATARITGLNADRISRRSPLRLRAAGRPGRYRRAGRPAAQSGHISAKRC